MHATPHQQPPFEEAVRRLSELGWSTRRIARHLARDYPHASQSSVVRARQRINTSPQPILRASQPDPDATATQPQPALNQHAATLPRPYGPAVLAAIALLVAAAAAAGIIWGQATAHPPPVTACVRYSASGTVTGLAARPPGGCPPGWQPVTLPAP